MKKVLIFLFTVSIPLSKNLSQYSHGKSKESLLFMEYRERYLSRMHRLFLINASFEIIPAKTTPTPIPVPAIDSCGTGILIVCLGFLILLSVGKPHSRM